MLYNANAIGDEYHHIFILIEVFNSLIRQFNNTQTTYMPNCFNRLPICLTVSTTTKKTVWCNYFYIEFRQTPVYIYIVVYIQVSGVANTAKQCITVIHIHTLSHLLPYPRNTVILKYNSILVLIELCILRDICMSIPFV